MLFRLENGFHIEQPHAAEFAAVFHLFRIAEPFSQHLKTAADTHEEHAFFVAFQQFRLQSALPQPAEICHCALGACKEDHVRCAQLAASGNIPHRHALHLFQRFEIRKVGNAGKPDNRHVQQRFRRRFPSGKPFGKAVLIVQFQRQIRHHAQHGNTSQFLQHSQPRLQDFHISAEFVDDNTLNPAAFRIVQQHDRTIK